MNVTGLSQKNNFAIVGIGASAGGLEAMEQFFSGLPVDTGMAFVIIQHLDPKQRSGLVEILSRATRLPVQEANEGLHVEPNQVYVIPPKFRMFVSGGALNLLARTETKANQMTIDFFFQSLAKDKKNKAIGVLLSGTASDGTLGLKAIRAKGGLTLVQDPKSAKYDGMPKSAIDAGVANFILAPKQLAQELARMARHPFSAKTVESSVTTQEKSTDNEVFHKIFSILQRQTGADISGYKHTTVKRRIQRRMVSLKIEKIEDYAGYLQSHPDEVQVLYEDVFIGVTEFFRDPESFLALKSQVFSQLLKEKISDSVRLWVPACSTGEEAYSLAITLLEFLDEQGARIPLQIFATDISESAVQKARVGVYTENQLQNLSKERLDCYFDKSNGEYKIKKKIRDLCIFSKHDVITNPPFANLDLISCRNLLIYFTPELQRRVLPIFHYALKPGGFLMLGKSETSNDSSKLFSIIDKTNKIYCKTNSPLPAGFRFPSGRTMGESFDINKNSLGYRTHFQSGIDVQRDFERIVMSKYAPAAVLVSAGLEILQVLGQTGAYLELPPGKINCNLLKMIQADLLPSLRSLIQLAKKQNAPARKEKLSFMHAGQDKTVNIEVIPTNPLVPAKERQFFVLFENIPDLPMRESECGAALKGKIIKKSASKRQDKINDKFLEQYIAQLQQELDAIKEHQRILIEEHESTQEELTSANEELQSANEELQSTNEEMETTKEELQASNEELTTTNDELHKRNIEWKALNADLTRETALAHLFETVAVASNESSSVDEALQVFLNRVSVFAGWSVGHSYVLSKNGDFVSNDVWYFDDHEKYLDLRKATDNLEVNASYTLMSRVLAARSRVLISDFANDESFARSKAAEEAGIVSAIGFPVIVADKVVAVLEFFSTKPITQDERFLELMHHMKPQLGRVIERKLDLEASKEADARMSATLNEALDCIITMDHLGKIQEFNPAAERTFGYKRSEVIGREMAEVIIPPRLRDAHRRGLAHYLASGDGVNIGRRVELSALRRDGSEFPVELTIARLKIEPPVFTGFLRDITERKKSDERLNQVIQAVPNGLLMVDQNGKITLCNTQIEKLFGYKKEELMGKQIEILVPKRFRQKHPGHRSGFFAKPETRQMSAGRDLTGLRKDATEFPVEIGLNPVKTDQGQFVLASIIDITERKSIEQKLIDAVSARDEFLSIASHELKTPLTSLSLQLQITQRSIKPEKKLAPAPAVLAKSLARALKQVHSLSNLIEELLDISRIQGGKFSLNFRPTNLGELVRDIVDRFSEDLQLSKVNMTIEIEDGIEGNWDRGRIEQVIFNLLSNVVKYASGEPAKISATINGDRTRVVLQDNGPGIPPERQAKIFERFERASSKNISGLGLGLFVTKRIIELHHGDIKVESTTGQGSRFIIDLPLNSALGEVNADSRESR